MAEASIEPDKDTNVNLATGSKKLISDSTSLVDLKAEVARKKQEALDNKAHGRHKANVTSSEKKNNFWSKENIGIIKRANADRERVKKEQLTSMKVQAALEQKAEIYDKLRDGKYVDKDSLLLVDFDQKDYEAQNAGEEWVEYVDPAGRTRTCMRSELEEMKDRDRQVFGVSARQVEEESPANGRLKGLEEFRQKWEHEEEENMRKPNLHFDDVTYDEARVYGAGRYKFSRNEAERTAQMDNLKEASKETEQARAKLESKKAQNKAKLEERLRKVRNKKRLKMGLPALPEDAGKMTPMPTNVQQDPQQASIVESVEYNLRSIRQAEDKDKERKKIVREWDVGKEGVMADKPTDQGDFRDRLKINMERKVLSQDEWVAKRRSERPDEFAPPVNYSKTAANQSSRPEKSKYSSVPPPMPPSNQQNCHPTQYRGHFEKNQTYSAVPPKPNQQPEQRFKGSNQESHTRTQNPFKKHKPNFVKPDNQSFQTDQNDTNTQCRFFSNFSPI